MRHPVYADRVATRFKDRTSQTAGKEWGHWVTTAQKCAHTRRALSTLLSEEMDFAARQNVINECSSGAVDKGRSKYRTNAFEFRC